MYRTGAGRGALLKAGSVADALGIPLPFFTFVRCSRTSRSFNFLGWPALLVITTVAGLCVVSTETALQGSASPLCRSLPEAARPSSTPAGMGGGFLLPSSPPGLLRVTGTRCTMKRWEPRVTYSTVDTGKGVGGPTTEGSLEGASSSLSGEPPGDGMKDVGVRFARA